MSQPTAAQQAQLLGFYKDWRAALEQQQAAVAATQYWQSEASLKEARFKGAAELVFGTVEVNFEYDEKSGQLTFNAVRNGAQTRRR